MWFPNRSDTNRPVQAQKRAESLKFRLYVEEELYYPSSENKGADQLCGYRSWSVPLFSYNADCLFSHAVAHIVIIKHSLLRVLHISYNLELTETTRCHQTVITVDEMNILRSRFETICHW